MANFLPKDKRVLVTIHGYSLNRTNQTQTLRIRFDLTQGDDTLNGLPEWIQNAFTHMVKTGNCAKKQEFSAVFPAATLECFASQKAKTRDFLVAKKADLSNFQMTRKGSDEEPTVVLEFVATFPKQSAIHKYIDETPIDEEVWMQFEQAQTTLDLTGDRAEQEEATDKPETRTRTATPTLVGQVPKRTPSASAVQ